MTKKPGIFAKALALLLATGASSPSGTHNVRGYRASGRDGFARICGMTKRQRRKLRIGR